MAVSPLPPASPALQSWHAALEWLAGRSGHSVLRPAGVQAEHIHALWQLTLWICAGVFALVLLALVLALMRARRTRARPPAGSAPADGRATGRWVTAATVASAALLVALLVADVLTGRALSRLPADDTLLVEMTAQQWWWETRYLDAAGRPQFATAGELRIPVGRPVRVLLRSTDVIHTFWVPSLNGKKDMLPGRSTELALRADRAGTYRGECAEFCGLQHALMAFSVTAIEPQAFAQWQAAQQAPATAPASAQALRGKQLFESRGCAACHTIRGTSAAGQLGPDLTHVGGRALLAAGNVPNTPARLAAWIVDPQASKPGATMPASRLEPADAAALAAYLTGLR